MGITLSSEELSFIKTHKNDEISSLLLSKRYADLDMGKLATMIEANKKIKDKIPDWYDKELLFISTLSVEQASSQLTAEYKQQFVINKMVADLTGGMGVDSFFISKLANKVLYIEQNPTLFQATKYNIDKLKICNIDLLNSDCTSDKSMEILDRFKPELIYIDPSRRTLSSNRVYNITEYTPNILLIKDRLLGISESILIKISPMADISMLKQQLSNIHEIHIVSVNNECKELLLLITKQNSNKNPVIISINIESCGEVKKSHTFSHTLQDELDAVAYCGSFSEGEYLYEPNSSILKGGAFKYIAKKFNLNKLHKNTHLFTSQEFISDFPGRILKIEEILDFNKVNIKNIHKKYPKANVVSRNFPIKSEDLKNRLSIRDGGEIYLFGTTIHDDSKKIIISTKHPVSLR